MELNSIKHITPYNSCVFNKDIISYLNVDSEGDVVSAETWVALWTNFLNFTERIDKHLNELIGENGILYAMVEDHALFKQEHKKIIADYTELQSKFSQLDNALQTVADTGALAESAAATATAIASALSKGLVHVGPNAPSNSNINLWIRPSNPADEAISMEDLLNKIDQTYNATSENAQSGIAVAEAIANDVSIYAGTDIFILPGTTLFSSIPAFKEIFLKAKVGDFYFNTEKKEMYQCIQKYDEANNKASGWQELGRLSDLSYNSDSLNAQSGKAVAEAVGGRTPKTMAEAEYVNSPIEWISAFRSPSQTLDYPKDSDYRSIKIDYLNTVDDITNNLPESIAMRNSQGNIGTNTPINETDCANKNYVDTKISELSGLEIEVVTALPETGEADKIYFVPNNSGESNNIYDEYIYTNNTWEKVGSANVEVDLTDYVKKDYIATGTSVGLVTINYNQWSSGLSLSSKGVLAISAAQQDEIVSKNQNYRPIVPSNLDYAVKVGLTTNTETLTDEEKAQAQSWLGITDLIGDIETLLGGI